MWNAVPKNNVEAIPVAMITFSLSHELSPNRHSSRQSPSNSRRSPLCSFNKEVVKAKNDALKGGMREKSRGIANQKATTISKFFDRPRCIDLQQITDLQQR
jgi:hypothetical protein